jgi:predicted acyltransferase (DUF342 family)
MLGICLVLFIVMLFFAFLPGWMEIKRKKDDKSMHINNNYIRDPEYFAKSFKKLLLQKTQDLNALEDGQQLKLSKPEIIKCPVQDDKVVGGNYEQIILFKQPVSIKPHSQFYKEVVCLKQAEVGQGTLMRAGLCLDNCFLSDDVQVARWLDAKKVITGKNCDLGVSTTAKELLQLSSGCHFTRLYAPLIEVGAESLTNEPVLPAMFSKPLYNAFLDSDQKIEEGKVYEVNVIQRHGDLIVAPRATITGSIKGYGKITIASQATVMGNVFGEKDVIIEDGARVLGDVFANGSVELGPRASIGQMGKCKSLVTKDGIKLHQQSRIYGCVSTDGEGIVL